LASRGPAERKQRAGAAGLVVGVAASGASTVAILASGIAGLSAGSCFKPCLSVAAFVLAATPVQIVLTFLTSSPTTSAAAPV